MCAEVSTVLFSGHHNLFKTKQQNKTVSNCTTNPAEKSFPDNNMYIKSTDCDKDISDSLVCDTSVDGMVT